MKHQVVHRCKTHHHMETIDYKAVNEWIVKWVLLAYPPSIIKPERKKS